MMQQHLFPHPLQGTIRLPPSKSFMQRACAAALLKGGVTRIFNFGNSNDDKAAIAVIKQLGAKIQVNNEALVIESGFPQQIGLTNQTAEPLKLDFDESGLGIRMFTPIAALLKQKILLTGKPGLTKRPMHFFDLVLPALGVPVQSANGYLPMEITGGLVPRDITIDGSLSSQFLTGLLMAYSATGKPATITVQNLASKPYIDISLDILKQFGLPVPVNDSYKKFVFPQSPVLYPTTMDYSIESDWSSASFLLVAAAINGSVTFTGLNLNSQQADKNILQALESANTKMKINDHQVFVEKSELQPFIFDATDSPDLFPPLAALAANAKGSSRIKGLKRLAFKESDRGLTLQEEFAKLGIAIELEGDEMTVQGTGTVSVMQQHFSSHNDHRIAMALAVAIVNAKTDIFIDQAEAVNKSYPGFFEDLAALQK
jgi:3-phosphoshikimate 1-carboxyvinyltransferase